MAYSLEHLLNKPEALSTNLSTTKTKQIPQALTGTVMTESYFRTLAP
jgi:hypothetical protein